MAGNAASIKRASLNERAAEYERGHQEHLFASPVDLLCPITHELFVDPVINTAGQVYERHAIETHLKYGDMDPVTRAALPAKTLTPVYILRSRALEYRESTARSCIEAACSPANEEPIRYLRRAAELCSVLPAPVQGLSPVCMTYVQSHTSNAYDERSLRLFAQGLFDSGYRDKAAAVFYSLLQSGADRAQQAELLQRCLECWSSGDKEEADARTFSKLAEFVSTQRTFTWSQIIEICQLAELGEGFTLRLCEQLLSTGNIEADTQSAVCLKYIQVITGRLDKRVEALEQQTGLQSGGSEDAGGAAKGAGAAGGGRRKQAPQWLNKLNTKALASAALLATTIANGQGPLAQFARIASLLCVLKNT